MKRLIVTADDFGAAVAVNEAVEQAHGDGILTCASLLVAGDAAADAVARAMRMPGLGVGLHLVLVEGRPVLPSDRIPDLIDADGLFRTDMVRAGINFFFRPSVRRQLAAEIEAQFAAFAATGLALDHVNAHKHFHLHPTITSLILEIGERHGIRAVRAPVEPRAVLNAIDRPQGIDIALPWARLVRLRLRKAGLAVPDQVFGIAWSGALHRDRLRGLLARLPDGLTEIYTHPAMAAYPGSALGYRYQDELAALTDDLAKDIIKREMITLGRFVDFAELARHASRQPLGRL